MILDMVEMFSKHIKLSFIYKYGDCNSWNETKHKYTKWR